MANILYTTGETEELHPANGKYFSLEELQTVVGGYIETLRVDDEHIMVLNEEGKFLNLSSNLQATLLVMPLLMPHDYIVGDVIVCSDSELG